MSPSAKLTSVEDEPDDPTRMMDRLPPPQAAAQRALDHAAIFNSPTKIIPRVRSGGVLSGVGANLLAYTRRPSVNLTLLLLAGLLLVGLGFVLGSARKEQHEAPPAEPATISRPAAETRAATPTSTTAPVTAIAVSSLPLAPPVATARESTGPGRSSVTAPHSATPDFALQPDRPPTPETSESKKGYVAPIRNPGF